MLRPRMPLSPSLIYVSENAYGQRAVLRSRPMPMPRIRAARRDDLPQVYRVLSAAFPHQPRSLFLRQTERDSTFRFRHLRVAEVEGKVMAVVRIFARSMLVRGVAVAAGGIGSVAAHPDARGLGLPTMLLRDALQVMESEGMALSFLFTGIPAFYERLGWRVVRQSGFDAVAAEAAALDDGRYQLHSVRSSDLPALLHVYGCATDSSTGAIVRSRRTWRDAQTWLEEDSRGCAVAQRDGRIVAYLRARSRDYGYQVMEAECLPGEEGAITALLGHAGRRAAGLGQQLTAYVPGDHALAAALRRLPSTRTTEQVRFPAMVRIISLERLAPALLDGAPASAVAASVRLHAPGEQALTLGLGPRGVRTTRAGPDFELDEAATVDAIFGQRRASSLLQPRPSSGVSRAIDALLPRQSFRFWNSDRI